MIVIALIYAKIAIVFVLLYGNLNSFGDFVFHTHVLKYWEWYENFPCIVLSLSMPIRLPNISIVRCTPFTYSSIKFGKRAVRFGELVSWVLRAEPKLIHDSNE